MTYDAWYLALNAACGASLGLDLADLPDLPFSDAFEDGLPPTADTLVELLDDAGVGAF